MLFTERHNIRPRGLRESVTLVDRSPREDDYGVTALLPLRGSGSGSGGGETAAEYGPFPASISALSGQVKLDYYQTASIEAYAIRMRYVAGTFTHVVWGDRVMRVDFVFDEGMRHRWLTIYASRRAQV